MARSDDSTVYSQTWREGEHGHYDPQAADPAFGAAQPVAYQQDPYAGQGQGYAQDAYQQPHQGHEAPQAEQPYDPYAASYDQHLAAPQAQPAAAPVSYAANPADYAPQQSYADPQATYQNTPPEFQQQPAGHAADPFAPQQWEQAQQQPAPVSYDPQPVTQPAQYGAAPAAQFGGQAPQSFDQYQQPTAPAQTYADPVTAPNAPYGGAAYGDYNPPLHAAPDPYAPIQHDAAAAGQAYANAGSTYSDFGQPQQQQASAGYATHDPYAFPQDNTLSHDPQTGPAYLDPSAFGQQQSLEPQFAEQQQYSGYGTAPADNAQDGIGYHDQDDYAHIDPAVASASMEPSRSRRGLIVVGALVAAVGIGGALGFAYKYSNERMTASNGNPPTIKANTSPSKEAPKNAGGKMFADQDKTIYTKLNTNRAAEKSATRLVSREEGVSLRSSTNGQTDAGGTRLTSLQSGERVNVPGVRRVRTLKVNPDGSFAESTSQGGIRTISSGDGESIPGITMGSIPTAEDSQAALIPKPKKKVVASLPKRVSVPKPTAAKLPKKRVASLGSAVPKPAASSGGGLGFVVQVAARRSRIDALAAFADLQQRYSKSLNAKQPDIQEVSIPNRGKWYRVRIGPPGSKNAAYNLCGSLKKSGLKDCLVKAY